MDLGLAVDAQRLAVGGEDEVRSGGERGQADIEEGRSRPRGCPATRSQMGPPLTSAAISPAPSPQRDREAKGQRLLREPPAARAGKPPPGPPPLEAPAARSSGARSTTSLPSLRVTMEDAWTEVEHVVPARRMRARTRGGTLAVDSRSEIDPRGPRRDHRRSGRPHRAQGAPRRAKRAVSRARSAQVRPEQREKRRTDQGDASRWVPGSARGGVGPG